MSLSQQPSKPTPAVVTAVVAIGLILAGLLGATVAQGGAPPTVKIGLVAPFEGEYRGTGYDVLFAVKLALQERNQGEGVAGYRVELVALNDFNDPAAAARQARALAADPDVMGVVGHLTGDATSAALPVYREAGLAVVAPWSVHEAAFQPGGGLVSVAATREETETVLQDYLHGKGIRAAAMLNGAAAPPASADAVVLAVDAVTAGEILRQLPAGAVELPRYGLADAADRQLPQVAGPAADGLIYVSPGPAPDDLPPGGDFAARYQALAGVPPTPRAALAYDATQILLDSIEKTIQMDRTWYNNRPSRKEVNAALHTITYNGNSGHITFNSQGRRTNPPTWLYKITYSAYPGSGVAP